MVETLKHKGVGMGQVSAKTKKRVKDALKGKKMELYRPFIVSVKEVHTQEYRVSAKTAKEAISMVVEGEGEIDESSFEYSHTLPADSWTVREEEEPAKELLKKSSRKVENRHGA